MRLGSNSSGRRSRDDLERLNCRVARGGHLASQKVVGGVNERARRAFGVIVGHTMLRRALTPPTRPVCGVTGAVTDRRKQFHNSTVSANGQWGNHGLLEKGADLSDC